MQLNTNFVSWFRSVAPYVNAFRGKTFVIAFSGEVFSDEKFVELVHDFNLLASLGVRLVLVHGARPQIQARLKENNLSSKSVLGMRVTDPATLQRIKESVGRVHVEIEALLSMGLPNSPMANASIRVTSGNFVTACPIGVLDGVDLMYSGKVRKINLSAIRSHLDLGELILISPLGYSPTGEIFNLALENVATETAIALNAEKLIFMLDSMSVEGTESEKTDGLPRELTVSESKLMHNELMHKSAKRYDEIRRILYHAIKACEGNVDRVHLINRHIDGAILQELFTHNGIGCMISQESLQTLRKAGIEDVGGILQLIEPLEAEGILVRRSRELLEIEIERFVILEHDGMMIGCAAIYPFSDENACELACLAVHPDYRNTGYGGLLLKQIEAETVTRGYKKIFVLTTHAAHWFIEHGFIEIKLTELPKAKQGLYNYQRRSKALMKNLQ
jgi:amino-acid N-acetyltransferase